MMLAALLMAVSSSWTSAAEDGDIAFFEQKIRPILAEHCSSCHDASAKKTKGGLSLSGRDSMLRGGDSGPAIVAGKPQQSLLVQAIKWTSDDLQMPPKKKLPDEAIAAIEKWIKRGAAAPNDAAATARNTELYDMAKAREHWAFRPLSKDEPPQVKHEVWVRTPIDRYILARLEAANLEPSPPADRATLIRRATFDLHGLPPTPEEVRAFIADKSTDAYEKVIDRLLASPRYGERWGRHWLDLARYADSAGFHDDLHRPNAWRYRDYVIASFNADKPYARFIQEQIAGDELAPDSVEAWIATGFARNGPSNENNIAPGYHEEYRLDQLDGVVSTISTVFLGVTLGCARCHDHKTDPILQRDYYEVLAVFNSSIYADRRLDEKAGTFVSQTLTSEEMLDKKGKHSPTDKPSAMALTDKSSKPRVTHVLYRGNAKMPGPLVEPNAPAALRHFAPIEFTASDKNASTTRRRLTFAQWIASPDNALTWRVMANRLWQHHFGKGIVSTPDNFGYSGDVPTHPDLLDYLARRLIEEDGRLKAIHKLIMTSSVYMQASTHSETNAARDPGNTLLWRMPKQRLEAEAIRDAILAVSGKLNLKAGGPGIKPRIPHEVIEQSQRNKWPAVKEEGPEHWRRSVYIYIKRQLLMPMMEIFDAPTTSVSCARRTNSTVPTQALTLLNGRFVNEQAKYFAQRVMAETDDDPAKQAAQSMWLALSREPSAGLIEDGAAILKQQRAAHIADGSKAADASLAALTDYCVVLFNTSPFLYVD